MRSSSIFASDSNGHLIWDGTFVDFFVVYQWACQFFRPDSSGDLVSGFSSVFSSDFSGRSSIFSADSSGYLIWVGVCVDFFRRVPLHVSIFSSDSSVDLGLVFSSFCSSE